MTVSMAYVEFALAHPALYHLMHGPEIPDKTLFPELNDAATRSYSLLEAAVGDYLIAHEGSMARSRDATLGLWTRGPVLRVRSQSRVSTHRRVQISGATSVLLRLPH